MPIINADITEISSTELDNLFSNTPDSTVNADNLIIGSQQKDNSSDIDEFDDSMFDDELIENLTDEQKAAKAEENAKKLEAEVKDADKEKEEDKNLDNPEVQSILKNTVDFLIDKGLWSDFEGRENLEITQEVYADLAQRQSQHAAFEIVNELIDSTGGYGKAIINHIKAGGNPDEIIDLFKEQKSIEQIDSSTEAGKKLKIEKYYTDILGWKPEKVNKVIKRLVEDNEVDTEYADVDELYNKHYEEKLADTQEETEKIKTAQANKQAAFVSSIQTALNDDTDLSPQDKKLIASSILDFKHKLENGQKVNDFYIKFAEMQADPKKYIKLVRYVMDNENVVKQAQIKAETKAAKESWNFIKGNQTLSKTKASNIEINDSQSKNKKSYSGTDFSFAIKK